MITDKPVLCCLQRMKMSDKPIGVVVLMALYVPESNDPDTEICF